MVNQDKLNEASEYLKRHCIALTGGIATGKSTVAKMLRDLSFTVIDADVLSRQCVMPGQPTLAEICAKFGPGILSSDGTLNRPQLRKIIFADPQKRAVLESIMHPAIQNALLDEVVKLGVIARNADIFYEASLIIETKTSARFRAVWCTLCDPDQQLTRLMAREKIDQRFAQTMISQQMPAQKKAAQCEVVIDTNLDSTALCEQLKTLVKAERLNP